MTPKHIVYAILGVVYIFLTYKFWTELAPIKPADRTGLQDLLTLLYWFSTILVTMFTFVVTAVFLEDLHSKSKRKVSEVMISLIVTGTSLYLALTYFYWSTVHITPDSDNAFYGICWFLYWLSSGLGAYWFIVSFFAFMEKKDRWNKKLW